MSSKPSDGSPTSLLHTDGDALPRQVLRAFDTWVAEQLQPCCIEYDAQFTLRGSWGNAAHFGFADIRLGSALDLHAPYLIGLDTSAPADLRFVTDQNGRHFHLHVISSEGRNFAIYVDVTTQYDRLRSAQQRSNDTALLYERQNKLVKQLIDASTELDARRLEAEAESRRRQRYMHAMSHDLKAPLQSVMLSIDTLQDDPHLSIDSAASVKRLRRALERQVSVLDRLIDEGRSQMEEERSVSEPVAMTELMVELSSMFAVFAAEKALRFNIEIDPSVPELLMLDAAKLRRVLINLVGNALKFTMQGFVAVAVAYNKSRELHLTVRDSGPGIAANDQKRVFEEYERTDSSQPGSGLGLSIVARLVQHMAGTVSLVSSPETGSCFTCVIPAPIPMRSGDSPVGVTRVLLCDDDPDITELVEQQLRKVGMQVHVCHSVQTTLSEFDAATPDIVVVDANLGADSGAEVANALRERGAELPILLFSSMHPRLGRKMAFDAGCDDFLPKPASAEALIAKIRQLTLTFS